MTHLFRRAAHLVNLVVFRELLSSFCGQFFVLMGGL